MDKETAIAQLNAATKQERLEAARALKKHIDSGQIRTLPDEGYTNNHVHTTYSYSPYSPAKAVYMAVLNGLSTVGIIDHDAIGGAEEFIAAGEIFGIATTIGFEIRTDWSDTRLRGRRINNPDQVSSAYICAHGLPHGSIAKADAYLRNIRQARDKRSKKIVGNINGIAQPLGISIDFETDVLPLSFAHDGGGVTERHLLSALTNKMMKKFGKGQRMVDVLCGSFGIELGVSQLAYLTDEGNEMYAYDLLNVFKSILIKDIYVDATRDEIVSVQSAVDFIKEVGAIPSYCYLGDVGQSPTGDKKAQKFEDDYLEDVLETARDIGFSAIAYMPSRNTMAQLERIMKLCDEYGFMQISGEDINQPRQSFICKQLSEPAFAHLTDTTWALTGHEMAASKDLKNGMFADGKKLGREELAGRIEKYKQIGLGNIE